MTLSLRIAASVTALALVGLLAACGSTTSSSTSTSTTASSTIVAASSTLWDATTVHDLALTIDETQYKAMLAAYLADGTKTWISATLVIDGTTLTNVGVKLKGNSTLRVVTADSDPATLPWLIKTDKYVDGQAYDGETQLVVRGSSSQTALNEALALELLGDAGLATQEAISSRFTVNGGTTQLRLVIQNPDSDWDSEQFGITDGLLYKADASGNYNYRGDDAASYTGIFDQEAGDDDLLPLTTFLKFINQSDDATFAADLSQYLDVDSFATYLAFQDLIDNFDDIAGPGNNSYLHYDPSTKLMTVVSWDLNLAFGQSNVGGGGGKGGDRPQGGNGGAGGPGGPGGPSGSNILAERFLSNSTFKALYEKATSDLTASLFTSGEAQKALESWSSLLTDQAADLVPAATITAEAAAVSATFPQ
jgi:spore coat protein CotH